MMPGMMPGGQGGQGGASYGGPMMGTMGGMGDMQSLGRLTGRVKSFNAKQGFGFIECPQVHAMYGRDVFLHKAQMGDLKVGTEITFGVEPNKQGMPQARDILTLDGRVPGPPPMVQGNAPAGGMGGAGGGRGGGKGGGKGGGNRKKGGGNMGDGMPMGGPGMPMGGPGMPMGGPGFGQMQGMGVPGMGGPGIGGEGGG